MLLLTLNTTESVATAAANKLPRSAVCCGVIALALTSVERNRREQRRHPVICFLRRLESVRNVRSTPCRALFSNPSDCETGAAHSPHACHGHCVPPPPPKKKRKINVFGRCLNWKASDPFHMYFQCLKIMVHVCFVCTGQVLNIPRQHHSQAVAAVAGEFNGFHPAHDQEVQPEPRPPMQEPSAPSFPPPESSCLVTAYPQRAHYRLTPSSTASAICVREMSSPGVSTIGASTANSLTMAAGQDSTRAAQPNFELQSGNTQQTLSVMQQPTPCMAVPGSFVSFVFNVRDPWGRDVHYQWFLGRHQLSGATSSRLVLTNVEPKDAGYYVCRAMVVNSNSPKGRVYEFSDWAELKVCKDIQGKSF